jgi:CheY-like chemotaxis protein
VVRILVADASREHLDRLAALLSADGHEVTRAADGVAAMTAALTGRSDLVVLSLHLPVLSGWVACRILKEDPATCRTPIAVVVDAGADERFWAEHSKADAVLARDGLDDSLAERVRALTAQRALADLSGPVDAVAVPTAEDLLVRVCRVLDRRLYEATVINEVVAAGLRAGDTDEVVGDVLKALRGIVPFDAGAIALLPGLYLGTSFAVPVGPDAAAAFRSITVEAFNRVGSTALTEGDMTCTDLSGHESGPEREWRSTTALPIQARGRLLGVLVLGATAHGAFGEDTVRTLRAVSRPVAAAVAGLMRIDSPTI